MLRIDNLKLPVGAKEDKLRAACAHALRVSGRRSSLSSSCAAPSTRARA